VISIQTHHKGQTTEIRLQQNGFRYRAGQYAFINIPAISPLQWHPFTISSSPDEDVITFHVKSMGRGTWTASLSGMCMDVGGILSSETVPVVNVDGPYGAPPDFQSSKAVVLVGGGIGITPVISLFKDLYYLHNQDQTANNPIKHVTLLWVVREHASLKMFGPIFNRIINDTTTHPKFVISLHVTGTSDEDKLDTETAHTLLAKAKNGRPNLHTELTQIISKHGHTSVMVCGPAPLVKEVRNVSYAVGVEELHEETFEL